MRDTAKAPDWLVRLELGSRAERVVMKAGCQSFSDILDMTDADWRKVDGCGPTTISEIGAMKELYEPAAKERRDAQFRGVEALEKIAHALEVLVVHLGAKL